MRPDTTSHSVWEVYDEYRTSRLNSKYYNGKLAKVTRRNRWIEMTLFATAPGSVVAGFSGLSFGEYAVGDLAWGVLGVIAGLLAIYKPVAKLTDKIRSLEEQSTKYRTLEFDFRELSRGVRRRKAYDDELRDRFDAIMERKRDLVLNYPEPERDEKLQVKCEDEVIQELPEGDFYIPPSTNGTG